MEQRRYIRMLLEQSNKFDITKYKEINFFNTHVSFIGTPKKHSTNKDKVIILTDPFSEQNIFYEFHINSIDYIEEIETITSEDGKTAPKMRLWIKKDSIGVKHEPFIV